MTRGRTTKKKSTSTRLPTALAKRAVAASSAKLARILDEAKRDLALIRRRRAEIADAFYDIGEALVRLKRREVVLALGCKTFAELCEKHVAISASQAERLIDIVENMTREAAIRAGLDEGSEPCRSRPCDARRRHARRAARARSPRPRQEARRRARERPHGRRRRRPGPHSPDVARKDHHEG